MANNRKIVILGTAFPLRGGLSAYNERIARAFQERGDDVEIYTFSLQYPDFLFPGKTQYSDDPAPQDLDIKVKVNSINPLNWWKIGREIKKKKPDLLIVKFWIPFMAPCLGTIARIVRRNKHTKVISIIDNIIPHEHRIGDRFLASFWVHSADAFIVMAKAVEKEMKQFTNSKPVLFNPHPIYDNFGQPLDKNIAKQSLNLEMKTKYILFFGFIRDYKGLDLLLRAMTDDRIRKMGVKLLVAGEFYTDSAPYYHLIEDLGLKDVVEMHTDFIADSKVGLYFSASDVVVQPYKTATQSGVTQIAYHFEKPMITTNVGGLAEIVENERDGFIVEPDPEEIKNAILRFYSENLEEKMTRFVKEDKKRFSWQKMLETIEKLT
jgi:glycosyltransferase involved in cell wall biosynthesis